MAIVVIRHGETDLNRARVVQPADTPLSQLGQAQARRLAARFADQPVAGLLCSDLPRARMTAAALERVCNLPAEPSPLLQERNFGDVRGTPYAALREDIFALAYSPPGGETWAAFEQRVAEAWRQLVERAATLERAGRPGHLLVVTHGLVCRTLAARHWVLAPGVVVPAYWHNTGLSVIAAADPHQVARLNCAAHLDPEPCASPGVSGI